MLHILAALSNSRVAGAFLTLLNSIEILVSFLPFALLRPVEVLQSNNEYTEEDVTDEVVKGGSVTFGSSSRSSDGHVFDFPGLRSDIEVMERSLFGGLSRFFDAAEEMKNGFFDVFGNVLDAESPSSSSMRRGIPIEEYNRQEASPKPQEKEPVDTDFAALAKDV